MTQPVLSAYLTHDWPADAVEVGRVIGAYGLRGQIKVAPLAADPQALLRATRWWLELGLPKPRRYMITTRGRKLQAGAVALAIDGVEDRTQAEAFKGATVFISRSDFPATQDDEFYWIDLIGLAVVNKDGVALGTVAGLLDNGAQGVLQVAYAGVNAKGEPAEQQRLIPFVSHYIISTSLQDKLITVDWQEDY